MQGEVICRSVKWCPDWKACPVMSVRLPWTQLVSVELFLGAVVHSPITNPFGIHRITQSHRHYSYSVWYGMVIQRAVLVAVSAYSLAHYSVIQCPWGNKKGAYCACLGRLWQASRWMWWRLQVIGMYCKSGTNRCSLSLRRDRTGTGAEEREDDKMLLQSRHTRSVLWASLGWMGDWLTVGKCKKLQCGQ